ncbi:MAG: PAS domain S-box protein [Candidatus Sumerlaeia bacterium]
MENNPAESQAYLQAIMDGSPDPIFIKDRRSRFLLVNPAFLTTTGKGRQEIIDHDAYEVFGVKEIADALVADDRMVMETGRSHTLEERVMTQAGLRTYLTTKSPFRNGDGQIIGVIGIAHDISDRLRADDALRESEEKYRRLVETANEGILQVDLGLRTIYVNARMAQMLGYAADEMIGRNYSDFTDPAERENNDRRFENRRKGIAEIYECRMLRKDGSKFWALVSASPLHDRDGNWLGSLGMFTDIHKRKQMERALRAFNETLEQRVAARTAETRRLADQLRALASELSQAEQRERRRLATILHDHIQQLLVAARLQLEWLGHEPEPARIKAATQGIDAILKEAIAASRSLTIDLSPPVLHQAGLVGGLSWLASRMLEKNQFTVHLRADSNAEPPTEEMRLLLFECVRELLFNAAKHSGASECEVTVMRVSRDRIRIIVQDPGKGFDPERLRNRRPDESTFGLFSIQQRLAHIGGHVEIETGVGRGTKVTITVQARTAAGAQGKARRAPAGIDVHGKAKPCRVLIVDDHKILRDGLRGLLQFEEGIEVVGEASDGPSGIALAEKLAPDVVIMDINLKEMNGIEATRAILAKNPSIKVVGLSMYLDTDAARAMHAAGAAAYVPKGGPSEDLIAAIRACAGDRKKT